MQFLLVDYLIFRIIFRSLILHFYLDIREFIATILKTKFPDSRELSLLYRGYVCRVNKMFSAEAQYNSR